MNRTLTTFALGRTTADFLFLNPSFLVEKGLCYGVPTDKFRVSQMRQEGVFTQPGDDGKWWQLRTVSFDGIYFIAPFLINSGGIAGAMPIVATPLLRKIGAMPENGAREIAPTTFDRFHVPSPLGNIGLVQDWDGDRRNSNIDERYNLIGESWAIFIAQVEMRARYVKLKIMTKETALNLLVAYCPAPLRCYLKNSANKRYLEREFDAVSESLDDNRSLHLVASDWATYKSA